ncbi:sensor histidine kinase [Streptomyces sp. NPDC006692]|uniref:sensor histidine kinase n=1 Tax=unclassified Streptomyces TaxID=2593676 RepID=UPI0036A87A93
MPEAQPEAQSVPPDGPAPHHGSGPRVVPGQDPRTQWIPTLLVIATAFWTIQPLGLTGRGLACAILVVVNSLALAVRHVPDSRLSPRLTLAWLTFGVLAAVALIGVSTAGASYLFAYFIVGHIGFRLEPRPALTLALLCGVLCMVVLYFRFGVGQDLLPWTLGFTTAAPVLIGMLNRSRHRAVMAALSAAESAERAARAEAQTAILTERGRIARDVHDVLAHSLAGINMQLELADALIDTGDLDRVREANQKAHSMVKESLKQAQWTVHALREDSLPLVESLTAMLDSSGHRDALTVTGTVRDVPSRVTQNLLRIAQEALTNTARHAPGGKVAVELTYADAAMTLSVRNGPATRRVNAGVGSGMGLIGMRERVALLNGTITAGPVVTGPCEGGWQVEAVIPG